MSEQIFKGVKIFAGSYDLSGDANKVALENGGTEVNTTTFAHAATRVRAGIPNPSAMAEGFVTFGATAVDATLRSYLGLSGVPFTVAVNNSFGQVACFIPATFETKYKVGAKVGDALPFNIDATAQATPLVNGWLFVGSGSKTANASSNGIQLGAVASGRTLHATLHVFSASGTLPTLDVIVESDSANTFGSANTALTFTQKTAAGYEAVSNTSVQTDTWYRVSYNLTGTNPNFSFAVAVGIY
jgi:hypothetical protein